MLNFLKSYFKKKPKAAKSSSLNQSHSTFTQELQERIISIKHSEDPYFLEFIRHLAPKADIDAQTTSGKTMLHMAIENRNISVATILLEHSADPNAIDKYQRTPLHTFITSFSKVFAIVTKPEADALKANQLFGLLIDNGADLNSLDTPILSEVIKMHFPKECIKYLVERGANINQKDPTTLKTPLYLAIDRGNEAIIKLLLSNGADLQVKNREGLNAIEYARKNRQKLVALIEKHHHTTHPTI